MNRDWIPLVAGVLEIVSGVFAFIGAAALAFATALVLTVPDVRDDPDIPLELVTGLLTSIALFVCALGLVALVGGIAAIRRRGWPWALAGAIAALFVLTPAGILALVMAIVGEREFIGRGRGSEPVGGRGG